MVDILIELYAYVLQGLKITLQVTFIAISLGFVIGILLAVLRVYGGKISSAFALLYSTVFRAVPLILLVLILYFVITRVVNLSEFWAGSLSLALASASYQGEIFRGAILSIPRGQMMAARSIGMTKIQAIFIIIIPQAIRNAIAPWSNEAAIILKDSSVVYILGVPEILRQAQYFSARNHEPFLAYMSVATIYLFLVILTNRSLGYLEKKLEIPSLMED